VYTRNNLGAARGGWQRYREVVTRQYGRGTFDIALRPLDGLRGRHFRGMGAIQAAGLISTGAAVGTTTAVSSLAAGTALGSWAGPIGAGVGALVGIIAGLWSAHDARVKGAKTENQIVGSAVTAWDQGMQAIFAAANSGQITGAQGVPLVSQLLSSYWAAVEQAKGLPGVADSSGYGSNCGSYTSGVTTPCTPSGHPACNKSCTAGCCVGCNDLYPSSLDAIRVLQNPNGGSFSTCTVYSSSFGLAQRSGYTLSYTPPAPTAANAATQAGGAIASAAGVAPTDTVLGIPVWLLALAGAGVLVYEIL
jgi:hypothetical protein